MRTSKRVATRTLIVAFILGRPATSRRLVARMSRRFVGVTRLVVFTRVIGRLLRGRDPKPVVVRAESAVVQIRNGHQ